MAKKNPLQLKRLKLIIGVVVGVMLFAIGFGAVKYLASTSTDSRSQAAGSRVYGCGTSVSDCPANQGYVSCVNHVCQKAVPTVVRPTAAIPTPVGNCSKAGEASSYGCCKGFMPDGKGRCIVAKCGKRGESAYYGCCKPLVPVNPCQVVPGEPACESVCGTAP